MQTGDLLTNESGGIYLVVGRNNSKKIWHRKIYVYTAALGVYELPYDAVQKTFWKINKRGKNGNE